MTVATSSLSTIQQKVRRLTRSPSESQLTTADLNQYINTFVLYDFPEHLRLFNLLTTFEFFTQPYVDTYSFSNDPTSVLYDFENQYISINPPIFIAGFQAQFIESRDKFFAIYPMINNISSIGVSGDGVTTSFTGYINSQQANIQPSVQNSTQGTILLQNQVLFSAIAVNNSGLAMIDWPLNGVGPGNTLTPPAVPGFGNLYVPGGAPTSYDSQDPNNYINYLTGEFKVTFPSAPQIGSTINSQTVLVQPTLPQTMLFYDGAFTMRPCPDQAYRVNMEVYQRPTELLLSGQNPNLNEWWQYIAYGAAKKILEDRMDLETVQMILPEFKKQEMLCQRRTIVQYTSQRTQTIYTESTSGNGGYNAGWFGNGSNF